MKEFILLFPFIIVTCQAYQLPLNRRLVARQGDLESNEPSVNDQFYEKLKKIAKKYMFNDAVDPDPQTLLVPAVYKPSYVRSHKLDQTPLGPNVNGRITYPADNHQYPSPVPSRINNPALQQQNSNLAVSRFTNPGVHTRSLINESVQLRQVAQADYEAQLLQQANAERAARLARVDNEALSKLSEEDRQILESKLSPTEREALLVKLEDGQLDDLLPREENRFGFGSAMGGFSGAAAQIGASAGGYIGGKLAGTLGAKLGAAAGAYLGAAAASRFVKKTSAVTKIVSNVISDDTTTPPPNNNNGIKYGATIGGFGAVMVNN